MNYNYTITVLWLQMSRECKRVKYFISICIIRQNRWTYRWRSCHHILSQPLKFTSLLHQWVISKSTSFTSCNYSNVRHTNLELRDRILQKLMWYIYIYKTVVLLFVMLLYFINNPLSKYSFSLQWLSFQVGYKLKRLLKFNET